MPIGGFLDPLPKVLLAAAHVVLLIVGLWAWKRARDAKQSYAPALWLYIASQVVFVAFFAGVFVVRMAILIEQTLVIAMVVWIALKARKPAA